MSADRAGLVRLGFGHWSLVESLRPDVAYPDRKVRRARSAITEVYSSPCPCPADHVEVWARSLEGDGCEPALEADG